MRSLQETSRKFNLAKNAKRDRRWPGLHEQWFRLRTGFGLLPCQQLTPQSHQSQGKRNDKGFSWGLCRAPLLVGADDDGVTVGCYDPFRTFLEDLGVSLRFSPAPFYMLGLITKLFRRTKFDIDAVIQNNRQILEDKRQRARQKPDIELVERTWELGQRRHTLGISLKAFRHQNISPRR